MDFCPTDNIHLSASERNLALGFRRLEVPASLVCGPEKRPPIETSETAVPPSHYCSYLLEGAHLACFLRYWVWYFRK